MKPVRIVTVEQALAQWSQFDQLLDARTPAEFAEDHLPGALNAPVLSDQQRIDIGTMYKQVSSFEAKKRGAALSARNIADYIEQHCIDKPREWRPLVYCWRGGNRSGSLAIVLAQIGFPVSQLEGGYKAFRTRVIAELDALPAQFNFHVLCGPTGSGKSRVLQELAAQGEQVLDLEALAHHRGSVLGPIPGTAQPGQRQFETRLWHGLRQLDAARPVFVECESKKVGNLRVPDTLMNTIRAGRCIHIETALDVRVRLLREDYPHWEQDLPWLENRLQALTASLGHDPVNALIAQARTGHWDAFVGELLQGHYDPAYLKSIARNFQHYPDAALVNLRGTDAQSTRDCASDIRTGLREMSC